MVLFKRYKYSSKPEIALNKIQRKYKSKIIEKIKNKEYKFEKVKECGICKNKDFKIISEKDRYGFKFNTVICENCGFVFTNPHFTYDSYNKFYENDYRNLYIGKEAHMQKLFESQYNHGKRIYEFVLKNIDLKDKVVVEIGVGSGGILKYFKDKGCRVYGVDFDEKYLDYGRNQGLELYFGSINELIKRNIKADLIIYSHVLEHIIDLKKELRYIRKIMKKQGSVYIEVPGIKNLEKNYELDFLKYLQNAHVYNFSLDSLKNLFLLNGFELIKGNENIDSLFRQAGERDRELKYTNDYRKVIDYLIRLEKKRRFRFFNKNYLRSVLSDIVKTMKR